MVSACGHISVSCVLKRIQAAAVILGFGKVHISVNQGPHMGLNTHIRT